MNQDHPLRIPESRSRSSVTWDDYGNDFQQAGSPWVMTIAPVSETDWQRFMDYLHKTDAMLEYFVDGEKEQLPENIKQTESGRAKTRLLSIQLGALRLECPCCTPQAIRLSFNPSQIDAEGRARILFRLMSTTGRLLDRQVVLGPEATAPVFEYLPGTGLRYHGCT
jgi:hypothetical protein